MSNRQTFFLIFLILLGNVNSIALQNYGWITLLGNAIFLLVLANILVLACRGGGKLSPVIKFLYAIYGGTVLLFNIYYFSKFVSSFWIMNLYVIYVSSLLVIIYGAGKKQVDILRISEFFGVIILPLVVLECLLVLCGHKNIVPTMAMQEVNTSVAPSIMLFASNELSVDKSALMPLFSGLEFLPFLLCGKNDKPQKLALTINVSLLASFAFLALLFFASQGAANIFDATSKIDQSGLQLVRRLDSFALCLWIFSFFIWGSFVGNCVKHCVSKE